MASSSLSTKSDTNHSDSDVIVQSHRKNEVQMQSSMPVIIAALLVAATLSGLGYVAYVKSADTAKRTTTLQEMTPSQNTTKTKEITAKELDGEADSIRSKVTGVPTTDFSADGMSDEALGLN